MKKIFFLLFVIVFGVNLYAQQRNIVIPNGHALNISSIIEDYQKKFLYTAEADKTIMWDIKTGKQLYSFSYPDSDGQPVYLDINKSGDKLLVYATGSVFLFDTKTGKQIGKTNFSIYESDVKFSDNGQQIYIGYEGIIVLDVNTLKELKRVSSNLKWKNKLQRLASNQLILYNKSGFEVFDMNTYSRISSFTYPEGKNYSDYVYHPFSQKLMLWSYYDPIDFYDVNTGKIIGTINYKTSELKVIPSQNSNEVLVTGDAINDNGYKALNIYDTKTFLKKSSLTNTTYKAYNYPHNGIFDGVGKKIWLIAYNTPYEYDLNTKKITRNLEGKISSLGMDVFNSIEYDYGTSTLHLSTDDSQFKTIDLLRMVSLVHTELKETPDAVAATPTGDTLAVFKENVLLLVNAKTGKTIKTQTQTDKLLTLQRSLFFFSTDGKMLHYPTKTNQGIVLMKMNILTGAKTSINLFDLSSLSKSTTDPQRKFIGGFGTNDASSKIGYVWNIQTGEKVFENKVASKEIEECFIRISQDGSSVLLSSQEGINIYTLNGNQISSGKSVKIHKFGSTGANNALTQIVTGSQYGSLNQFSTDGSSIRTLGGHNSTIRKVEYSSDDQFIYTIGLDNAIKIWNASTGKLIGTLYLFKNSNDYVFMTDDGRFDGTPNGIKQIYYVQNQQPMELDKLFEVYYTPNLYQRIISGEIFAPILTQLNSPPKVKIKYEQNQRNLEVEDDIITYKNTSGTASISVEATAPNDRIDEIRLFHNGKAINLANRGMFVADNDDVETKKFNIPLLPGANHFRAVALNSQRTESEPDEIIVQYGTSSISPQNTPTASSSAPIDMVDKKATLHLIVVGINQYENAKLNLNYAIADATAFKDEIHKDATSVLSNVKTYFVADDNANTDGIKNAFTQVQNTALPGDIFIFYYAGHGVISTRDKEFYLVPTNVSNLSNADDELAQKGISSKDLQQFAVNIPAQKQVFILDACQSAGAFEKILQQSGDQQKSLAIVARSTGTHWLAASGSQQYANEFGDLGHGAFTYVLLDGLKGKAALNKMITVIGLRNYLQTNVPELLKKYAGTPQYPASYGFGNDFPVEILK